MTEEMMMAKMEIKELVDTFSILADEKDVKTQALLFAKDAALISYNGTELISEQHGREEIEAGCTAFLSLFDTVYHMNGQQVVTIDGNHAKGKSYCQVVLIGKNEEGKRITCSGSYKYISRRITGQIMESTWRADQKNPYVQNIIMTYVSQSTLEIYKQWVADGKRIPLEDIINIAIQLVCNGINGMDNEKEQK